jgi:cytosine/adenosine deaminase-related metal-dependent hydrolase
MKRLEYAGAQHDPVAAVIFAAPVNVDFNYVAGRPVVREGHLVTLDLEPLIEHHNRLAAGLFD